MLSQPHRNVWLAGDDDQSIHGFRGARSDIFVSFGKECGANAKTITMSHNYRSTGRIIKAANNLDAFVKSRKTPFSVIPANPGSGPGQAPESSLFTDLQNTWTPVTLSRRKPGTGVTTFYEAVNLISHNNIRVAKQMVTDNEDGEEVEILQGDNEIAEAEIVARKIIELTDRGYRYGEIAILARLYRLMPLIEGALIKEKIPYNSFGEFLYESESRLRYRQHLHHDRGHLSEKRLYQLIDHTTPGQSRS